MIHADKEKEKWSNHSLYIKHTKAELEALCHSLKIPVTSAVTKHQLVSLVSAKRKEAEPPQPPTYSGNLATLPNITSALTRIPVGKLREVLHYHDFPTSGIKEQLVLRVFLLRQGCTAAITAKEENKMKNTIKIHYKLILAQRKLNCTLSAHTYYKRTHSSSTSISTPLFPLPETIHSPDDLHLLFAPLLDYMNSQHSLREINDDSSTLRMISRKIRNPQQNKKELLQEITQTGAKIKVKWSAEEIGDTGWKPGWYVAVVTGYNSDTDTLLLEYPAEPGCSYELPLTPTISCGNIKLVKAVF